MTKTLKPIRISLRLLEKPQYGERLAMYWLDIVRYTDSNGYHADKTRQIAPTDYVINSFNPTSHMINLFENGGWNLMENATMEQQVASDSTCCSNHRRRWCPGKRVLSEVLHDHVEHRFHLPGVTLG